MKCRRPTGCQLCLHCGACKCLDVEGLKRVADAAQALVNFWSVTTGSPTHDFNIRELRNELRKVAKP